MPHEVVEGASVVVVAAGASGEGGRPGAEPGAAPGPATEKKGGKGDDVIDAEFEVKE